MRQFNLKYVLGDWESGQAAAGTTQATGTTLTATHNWVGTATGADGVVLKEHPPGSMMSVANADSADGMYVYPWSGASLNGATANVGILLPAGHAALFFVHSSTKIAVVY